MKENQEPTMKEILLAIEELAENTTNSFSNMETRSNTLENRFDVLENRFAILEQSTAEGFAKNEKRFQKIEDKLDEIIHILVTQVATKLDIRDLDLRVTRLEKQAHLA